MDKATREAERYYERRQLGIERLGGKCIHCGSTEDLEFDHKYPQLKQFNVSQWWSIALDTWFKEIDKCQLLCKPCHKKKTYGKSLTHNRWRYLRYKCRCAECKEDYSLYRRTRTLKAKKRF